MNPTLKKHPNNLTRQSGPTATPTTLNGSIGYPEHSAVSTISYSNGPWNFFTTINYTGPVKQDPDEPDGYREFQDIGSVTYVDMGFSVDVTKRTTFRVMVDNVFDAGAPFPVPPFGGRKLSPGVGASFA